MYLNRKEKDRKIKHKKDKVFPDLKRKKFTIIEMYFNYYYRYRKVKFSNLFCPKDKQGEGHNMRKEK